MTEDQRAKVFDYVYRKADEAGYLALDSVKSGEFQDALEADLELIKIAGKRLERNYIKDTILNNYSKDRRYINIKDVLEVIQGISRDDIVEAKPALNDGIFHISYKGQDIECTSTSLDQWHTSLKRFGRAGGAKRLVFLTCKGISKDESEVSDVKEKLKSYGIASVIVKPNQPPVFLADVFPSLGTHCDEVSADFFAIASEFNDAMKAVGIRCAEDLPLRFLSALLAKRFCILTGLSGSGKTKLAHAVAAWLTNDSEQYRLVAVGADWTTNENVLGYQDAITPNTYRRPSSGALDIILLADRDLKRASAGGERARPYFLILDEMNLSHVERYFADILSTIESGQEIALHSSDEGSLKAGQDDTLPVPKNIRLPENLFIVGTVNIDETTYMFSPKVLDRANVVEFRASAEDIAAFLEAPSRVDMTSLAGKGSVYGQTFVAEARSEVKIAGGDAATLKERLTELFGALAAIGAEFGFRTAYEITRFVHFHKMLSGEDWKLEDALDAQVLQKLMPKLHGSERKLGPVLEALDAFCEKHGCEASRFKIKRMQDRLKADGFTSFAEA